MFHAGTTQSKKVGTGERDFHIKVELERVVFSTSFFCLFLFPFKEKWNCACWNKQVGVSEGQMGRIILEC